MEKVWNDFDLRQPPFVTLPAKYSPGVLNLHTSINDYFRKYGIYEQEFNETAALLSRLMARRKNSFNKMKGFKDVCKLNAALCRLLRVDFNRDLDRFRNSLPDVDYSEGTNVQMPTRDSFDFVLIRLIAIYELYRRICDCCVSAAEYFTCQIRLLFFFEINTLLLAVLAKINSMATKLLNVAVDLYNNTLQYRLLLPINLKSKFMQDCPFEFPAKLEIVKLNDEQSNTVSISNQPLNNLLHQEEKLEAVKAKKLKKVDVGAEVQRSPKIKEKSFDIEELKTVEKIKRFIATEDKSRSTNLKDSITGKILGYEWSGAVKLFERKVQKGEGKKAVNIFRKFLCLKM